MFGGFVALQANRRSFATLKVTARNLLHGQIKTRVSLRLTCYRVPAPWSPNTSYKAIVSLHVN
jgi:hypothetical protein